MSKLFLLELNEINFEAIRDYSLAGKLPVLASLIDRHGLATTRSESKYEHLEPWIQWVSAHTGKTLAEHGVFRLGDIVNHDLEQVWEQLEDHGHNVGAVSPMNANNRTKNARFFVPDPWTDTKVTGSLVLRKLSAAVSQAVNDNSSNRLSLQSVFWTLLGAAVYARVRNYGQYLRLVIGSRKRSWFKAMFLDLLLSDVFVSLSKRKRPDFASLFVNAGAHIQHHYMFNSAAYDGDQSNPEWYVSADDDPVLDVYRLYDRIVGDIVAEFPDTRLMIATGLHQDPHPATTYYWRLADHGSFLRAIGVDFETVEPRMSRDFLVTCGSVSGALACQKTLESAVARDGVNLFEVDNRGRDLFVMLTYPNEIGEGFEYTVNGQRYRDLLDKVVFVAIKNGQHNGIGYFIDSGNSYREQAHASFPITDIPELIKSALPSK